MPSQSFQAKVAEHTILTSHYHWLTFDLSSPTTIEFQAGQFILLNIPGSDQKRAYSIASSPANTSQINLLIDVRPQGVGTTYLQSLQPGNDVSFTAPWGKFTLSDNPLEEKITLLATGSGISVIRSMALWLLQTKQETREINLHWGMRQVENLFWVEEFRLLETNFPNFHFDLVLSQPPDGWPLCRGHISRCLAAHYTDFSHTGFYICGSPKMVDEISTILTTNQVDPTRIHHERF